MKKRIEKILIVCLILCLSILLYKQVNINNSRNYSRVNNNTNQSSNNLFGMFIKDDTGNYVEYDSNSWPSTSDYQLDKLSSYCFTDFDNINGTKIYNVVDFDEDTNEAIVKSNQELYCYLYFDKKEEEKPNIACKIEPATVTTYHKKCDPLTTCSGEGIDNMRHCLQMCNLDIADTCDALKLVVDSENPIVETSGIVEDTCISTGTYTATIKDSEGNTAQCSVEVAEPTIKGKEYALVLGYGSGSDYGYNGCTDPNGCSQSYSEEIGVYATESECQEEAKKYGGSYTAPDGHSGGGGGASCNARDTYICTSQYSKNIDYCYRQV